ncbi:MAG: hypothetical protein WKG07_32925 [Hymenobacter sp.]
MGRHRPRPNARDGRDPGLAAVKAAPARAIPDQRHGPGHHHPLRPAAGGGVGWIVACLLAAVRIGTASSNTAPNYGGYPTSSSDGSGNLGGALLIATPSWAMAWPKYCTTTTATWSRHSPPTRRASPYPTPCAASSSGGFLPRPSCRIKPSRCSRLLRFSPSRQLNRPVFMMRCFCSACWPPACCASLWLPKPLPLPLPLGASPADAGAVLVFNNWYLPRYQASAASRADTTGALLSLFRKRRYAGFLYTIPFIVGMSLTFPFLALTSTASST